MVINFIHQIFIKCHLSPWKIKMKKKEKALAFNSPQISRDINMRL